MAQPGLFALRPVQPADLLAAVPGHRRDHALQPPWRGDQALYQAKAAGRDTVVASGLTEPPSLAAASAPDQIDGVKQPTDLAGGPLDAPLPR
jgi:hypothetical protein